MQDKLSIRLDLEGELLKKFNDLRDYLHIRNGTELLRFLIGKAHRQIIPLEPEEL